LVPLPLLAGPKPPPACQTRADLELRFSPDGGCTKAIVDEIRAARSKILVLAYSFTSDQIEQALVASKDRGVDVQVIIDRARTGERSSGASVLDRHAVKVYSDGAHSIQHQKVMIIDPDDPTATIILGSFNFTKSAEDSNSENIVVIRSQDMARVFVENWELHRRHSKLYGDVVSEGRWRGFLTSVETGILIGLAPLILCLIIWRYRLKRKNP